MEEAERSTNRSYTYILKGEPDALVLRRTDDITGWNSHKERKLITEISLESQHNDRPLITGPITFDVNFYFAVPHSFRAKIKAKHGDLHSVRPSLSLLLNFLEHSAEGILFSDSAIIVRASFAKLYDADPRTVLVITELYEEKNNIYKKERKKG
jgi:Holliday junction resolvase RusA-like endonuclease